MITSKPRTVTITTCKPFAERYREIYLKSLEQMALMNSVGARLIRERIGCGLAWGILLDDGLIAWRGHPETGEPSLHITRAGIRALRKSGQRYWPEKHIDWNRLIQNAN